MRYSVTTREPGASEVLMCFFTVRPRSTAFLASRPAASSTPGLEVLVQEVIAAISVGRADLGAVEGLEPLREPLRLLAKAGLGDRCGEKLGEFFFHVADLDAILRALGAGQRGRHGAEVQLDRLAVVDGAFFGMP